MISSPQLRAARAMLNWSATELAERTGTSRNTIQRLEQSEGVPASRTQTLIDIQRVFEAAGIEFIGTSENGPGVRLNLKSPTTPRRPNFL